MILLYQILTNLAVIILVLFGSNYTILRSFASSKIPSFLIVMIVIFISLSISGGLLALWSSLDNCGRMGHLNNTFYGGRLGLAALLGYIIVYYFDFLRKPFTTIGGDTIFTNTIAIIFYLTVVTSPIVLLNHYDSIKGNCKLSMSEIEEKVRVLDKELNKIPDQTPPEKILVSN